MHSDGSTAADNSKVKPGSFAANKIWRECRRLGNRLRPSKLRQVPPRLQHQLKLQYHWWLKQHQPYQPIFVLATPRSGSNLMSDYLNRLPNVECHWEVLNASIPEGPSKEHLPRERALRHIRYSLQSLVAPIRGCKFLLYQLDYCDITLSELGANFPGSKYIVLYRQSLTEQYVSLQSATATNQWVLFNGQKARRTRIAVDVSHMRRFCQATRQQYHNVLNHPTLLGCSTILSYEELTEDPASCFRNKICPLLDVPFVEPKTDLCKQNPYPLAERILNYAQVAAFMASPLCWQQYHLPSQAARRAA